VILLLPSSAPAPVVNNTPMGPCMEAWKCSDWSACSNGLQNPTG
jgi:hypothetical protein